MGVIKGHATGVEAAAHSSGHDDAPYCTELPPLLKGCGGVALLPAAALQTQAHAQKRSGVDTRTSRQRPKEPGVALVSNAVAITTYRVARTSAYHVIVLVALLLDVPRSEEGTYVERSPGL